MALVAMLTFLATDSELADWIISLSAGTTPEELADVLRERARLAD